MKYTTYKGKRIKEMSHIYQQIEHGGNIYRLAEELKIQERNVIDFSTTINPLRVSKKVKAEIRKSLKNIHNYPDHDARRLRKRLAQYHTIDMDNVICGNGSTELIYLMARTLRPQRVLIPAPTFSEYERAVYLTGSIEKRAQIEYLFLKAENDFRIIPDEFNAVLQKGVKSSRSFDMAFLCNPNNPTSRLIKKEDVLKIAEEARKGKCYLVVDEALIDFCAEETVIKEVENNPYLIVLRSMESFYALPGLRFGYGIFPEHLIARLNEQREPWTVNSLSQRAAVIALKDKGYRKETVNVITAEKKFLEKSFKKLGIEFSISDTNFYLIRIDNADEICHQLKTKGILVRNCDNFHGLDSSYIRITVKSHRENTILIKALTSILHRKASANWKS